MPKKKKSKQLTVEMAAWWMAPVYGKKKGAPEIVYSPTEFEGHELEYAFKMARRLWPTADGWEVLGAVDAKDIECRILVPESGTRQVVRMTRQRASSAS